MSFDVLVRSRLAEPGMYFHFGGEDVVDLRQVDWAQLEDADGHTVQDRGGEIDASAGAICDSDAQSAERANRSRT